jgi:hypothetical protein
MSAFRVGAGCVHDKRSAASAAPAVYVECPTQLIVCAPASGIAWQLCSSASPFDEFSIGLHYIDVEFILPFDAGLLSPS